MERHEATFEITSKSDAYAVRLLTEALYDALREELRDSRGDVGEQSQTLEQFAAIHEATKRPSSGSLTVVYERDDGSFDD